MGRFQIEAPDQPEHRNLPGLSPWNQTLTCDSWGNCWPSPIENPIVYLSSLYVPAEQNNWTIAGSRWVEGQPRAMLR
jgi:hypothetical protein